MGNNRRSVILSLVVLLLVFTGIVFYVLNNPKEEDWIDTFGFLNSQVYELEFNEIGCPMVPVMIGDKTVPLFFDTGCSSGLTLTDVLEDSIDYELIGQTEQLNRDGSHRGWSKKITLDQFSVFGKEFTDITTTMVDWEMISSKEFQGLLGIKYFDASVITLDYAKRKIAINSQPIDYVSLDNDQYVVLPLLKTSNQMQENLLFFEASYQGEDIVVYLDTGKNHSFVHNPDSTYAPGAGRPQKVIKKLTLQIQDMEVTLSDVYEANLAQAEGLPNSIYLELNSDQLLRNGMVFTIDLIEDKIIFRR